MYFTDTRKQSIDIFDYDRKSGELSNRRVFVRVEGKGEGRPDGMTVDAEGCVWSARWDGGCVVRYDPEGAEMARIRLPTRKVSSVTFGGDEYTEMYITTAGGRDRAANGEKAGALFRVATDVKGVPEFVSRVRTPAGT
jgi:D-xylonolactonase